VFARKVDGNLTSLVKEIDESVGKHSEKKLCSFVVILTDDSDEVKEQLEKLAEKEKIQNVPLTIGEIPAGPPSYKIDKDAEVTVLLWKGLKVTANHAFKAGGMKKSEIDAIMKDVEKLVE
jgi:hypothetical protein